MDKPHENGHGVEKVKVPFVRIVFNPDSYQCVVDGSTPNLEFARYMLQTALDLTNKQIAERDNPRIAVASPMPTLPHFQA